MRGEMVGGYAVQEKETANKKMYSVQHSRFVAMYLVYFSSFFSFSL